MFRSYASAAAGLALAAAATLAQTATFAQTPGAAAAPAPTSPASAAADIITPNASIDIVANLKASGKFTTLLKALDGSGLTGLLSSPGAFTLFAPTDEAFAAVPADTLATLMKPENAAQLQALVAYHVVNTKILKDQIEGHAAAPVPSVVNKPITVDGLASPMKINDAQVLQAAAPASNGVIYVIDKVLTPPQ